MSQKPKIVNNSSLKTKVYIEFYFEGKRVREYSGKKIGLRISPNTCTSIRQRTTQLVELADVYDVALKEERYLKPVVIEPTIVVTLQTVVDAALEKKLGSNLSLTYKRDLRYIHDQFLVFLTEEEKKSGLETDYNFIQN